MSFWGEHSVHTVYCDLNWLAKQIKIIKINNIFLKKNHVILGGTLSPYSVLWFKLAG